MKQERECYAEVRGILFNLIQERRVIKWSSISAIIHYLTKKYDVRSQLIQHGRAIYFPITNY